MRGRTTNVTMDRSTPIQVTRTEGKDSTHALYVYSSVYSEQQQQLVQTDFVHFGGNQFVGNINLTHPTGRYESSAWFTVSTASDKANPLDSNAECTFIVSSTEEKSSSGFSPGKTKSFFIRLALHIPPKYASSHSNQFNVEFGNFVCKFGKRKY